MDFYSAIMGFGFGAVAGAMLADLLHITWLATPLFFLCGAAGAAVCSGAFGDAVDIGSLFS